MASRHIAEREFALYKSKPPFSSEYVKYNATITVQALDGSCCRVPRQVLVSQVLAQLEFAQVASSFAAERN